MLLLLICNHKFTSHFFLLFLNARTMKSILGEVKRKGRLWPPPTCIYAHDMPCLYIYTLLHSMCTQSSLYVVVPLNSWPFDLATNRYWIDWEDTGDRGGESAKHVIKNICTYDDDDGMSCVCVLFLLYRFVN